MEDLSNAPTLVLVRDLLFTSKITATAGAIGAPVKVIRDPARLMDERGSRLIVDLNQANALESSIAWKAATGGTVIGFVSHVDRAIIDQARALGVDEVLPRSVFVHRLTELLR